MSDSEEPDRRVSLLGHKPPPWARLRLVRIAPRGRRLYAGSEWHGTLVVVERGSLELEAATGCRLRFEEGAVLCLAGLAVRALHNPSTGVTLLSALSRRSDSRSATPYKRKELHMKTTTSADGTRIAYDEIGTGPPLILAAGAFNDRQTTAPLAEALADRFTVLNYDRRGRGGSGDTAPYAVEREIEDLDALIAAAGGSASVFGYSSGAVLVLEAAAAGSAITALALYEPPFLVDDSRPKPPSDMPERLRQLIAEGRRGEAVELYQLESIGLPQEVVAQLRNAPFRPGLEAIAHTLVYDAEITRDTGLPVETLARVTVPAVVICGGESWGFLQSGAAALADALPHAQLRTLPGETHQINPEPTADAIADFVR